ncbi:peptidylprolyl isomerase [Tetragenococcus koreensis]|uniref:peptidylprolyl isomerase n=1 Tax=Tetragenococcus koreensis TaxID=290335 RepID=UPI001F4669EE|nr:peptidylprolyl isomerase [Tetragenococcus koreensis]MCF1584952.1 peptidylprolyl isomerase [Tetragenococcus koreensis]MCF1614465.1 peptidylprolyl isomerase [Tetragenococcus koreensis]MCF1617224.1 peptidylprolyl isomerase [Tetragenococcus koreensis]MCF1619868.1 peptidylprolyl isomerase [Tetragenococcus koreensis]MCF1622101.1 peptidylprolyl isomerase [Tetragenococcus koreensis]
MKKKKIILSMTCLLSVFGLAACSGDSDTDDEIATMKGDTITVGDFYDKAKTDQNNQQIVLDMIISQVFTEKYGDEVSDDEVDQQITDTFGDEDTLNQQLEASQMSRDELEETYRQSLAVQKGLEDHVNLTDDDLKEAWESYHPQVEAQLIAVTSEDDANEVKDEVDEDDADFGKIAEENSIAPSKEDDGNVKFDSTTPAEEVPDEVKEEAWDMEDGDISDPIAVESDYGSGYYILKMNKNQDKGNDMDKYEDEIQEVATDNKINDQEFTTQVIGEELQDANVKIQDEAFSDVLAQFTDAANSDDSSSDSADEETTEATETEESSD